MRIRKILLISILLVIISLGFLLFLNRDKIVYVGKVNLVEVDCSEKAKILEEVFESDQRVRTQDVPFQELARVDHRNQEWVISILEKCGMPSKEEVGPKQMNAVWIALQHSQAKIMKKYFPFIEEAVARGDLDKEKFALMKDRILMSEGKAQIYGSQIRNGKLYKLEDPTTVNKRREEMGMESIEKYLSRFDIEYQAE